MKPLRLLTLCLMITVQASAQDFTEVEAYNAEGKLTASSHLTIQPVHIDLTVKDGEATMTVQTYIDTTTYHGFTAGTFGPERHDKHFDKSEQVYQMIGEERTGEIFEVRFRQLYDRKDGSLFCESVRIEAYRITLFTERKLTGSKIFTRYTEE